MAKVLTHHNTGSADTHWFTSSAYGTKQIEGIAEKDPTAGKTHIAPTSIPSPFAQMDLTVTAFKNASKDRSLQKVRNIDFKLISDCLDIGEIFFNFEKLKSKARIITWDRTEHLQLLKSGGESHKRLAEVIELYLTQDKKHYNFADLKKIYLLEYDHHIIGGTSSASFFFSSANDLSFVNITMPNGDTLLDKEYLHLYMRDIRYQEFWYGLRKAMPDFSKKFPYIDLYLEINFELLQGYNSAYHARIKALTTESYRSEELFDNLTLGSNDNNKVFVFSDEYPMKRLKVIANQVAETDFAISSKKYQAIKKPMVLRANHDGKDNSGQDLMYYENPYRRVNPTIPNYHPVSQLEERELPGVTGVKYPFLVVSDFLEPYMMRLPYPVNSQQFFNGNLQLNRDTKGYILPIKKMFFDFFDTDDLKNMLKLEWRAGGSVNVRLEIPIQKGQKVAFERLYSPALNEMEIPTPDENRNEGVIVQQEIGVTIYPFVKIATSSVSPDYRVLLVDRDIYDHTKNLDYKLNFYKNTQNALVSVKSDENQIRQRTDKHNEDGLPTTVFFIVKDNFDYIQVKNDFASGIIVPNFPSSSKEGNKQFSFAVDFGTTNTHIEYIDNQNKEPRPFDITEADLQIGTLHERDFFNRDTSINGTSATEIFQFPTEYLPEKFGEAGQYRFPQRTILAQVEGLTEHAFDSAFSLADFNIPFVYEKLPLLRGSDLYKNLKWANSKAGEDKKRTEAFFEQLLFMIRAKILKNGGNLSKTKLVTFYPSSMDDGRRKRFAKSWRELFHQYISNESDPILLPESIAPYYHYKKGTAQVNSSVRPAVTVDIGGGTTDIVIFKKVRDEETSQEDEKIILQTSFRFAAHAMFGDGFLDGDYTGKEQNGFVLRYKEKIKKLIEEGKTLYDLQKVYQQIVENNTRSEDIITFFFSLQNNKEFTTKTKATFSKMLEDDDEMRFIFVFCYISIVYHIAKLMQIKGLQMPSYITFSGNGSRVLEVVAPDNKTLQDLASIVIQKVYGAKEYEKGGLTVARDIKAPKEATCKGGLRLTTDEERKLTEHENVATVLVGIGANTNNLPLLSGDSTSMSYRELISKKPIISKLVEEEVETFINFVFELNKDYNFNKKLLVEGNLNEYKNLLLSRIDEDLARGLEIKMSELNNGDAASFDNPLEETLFFYPLIPALNRLALSIHQKNN